MAAAVMNTVPLAPRTSAPLSVADAVELIEAARDEAIEAGVYADAGGAGPHSVACARQTEAAFTAFASRLEEQVKQRLGVRMLPKRRTAPQPAPLTLAPCLHPLCSEDATNGGLCSDHHDAVVNAADAPSSQRSRNLTTLRLSAEPLVHLKEHHGGVRPMLSRGLTKLEEDALEVTIRRSIERGWVSVVNADRIAVRGLRRHPSDVWGQEWWAADQVESDLAEGASEQMTLLG